MPVLPLIKTTENTLYKFVGKFDGTNVIIDNLEDIERLYSLGCFGEGTFSRSRRSDKGESKESCVPNQDNFKLFLEEAFFLHHFIGCLDIYDKEKLLNEEIWQIFTQVDPYFIQNYTVYHYYRAKNWVVKSGVKYGGKFVLYKDTPEIYHSSFLVIIDVLDADSRERKERTCKSMEIENIKGLNRLCETVGKELLVCQILWPQNQSIKSCEDIKKLTIDEIIMSRWIPSVNRK